MNGLQVQTKLVKFSEDNTDLDVMINSLTVKKLSGNVALKGSKITAIKHLKQAVSKSFKEVTCTATTNSSLNSIKFSLATKCFKTTFLTSQDHQRPFNNGALSKITPLIYNISRCYSTTINIPTESTNVKKTGQAALMNVETPQDQSFVCNMFAGRVIINEVFPYPYQLSDYEKERIKSMVEPMERFFSVVRQSEDQYSAAALDAAVLKGLWDVGIFAAELPASLGGAGLTNSQFARINELVGSYDLSVGITIGAHQSIGLKGLMIYGSTNQKNRYIPKISSGELCAFCLTERGASGAKGMMK